MRTAEAAGEPMTTRALTDAEFTRFQRFIHDTAGISLSTAKKALVSGRIARRLQEHGLSTYSEYLDLLTSGDPAEVQTAVDLLTTNETYFFREPKHFESLSRLAQAARTARRPFRVWSAACSSGEEPYSIAMVLSDVLGDAPWEVLGTDISSRVLDRARSGHYPEERTRQISADHLKRYCLRGIDEHEGTVLVQRALRQRVRFAQVNLNMELPPLGYFDVVFLRNVMIYFDTATKRQVVARILGLLAPGGTFCIGHTETLHELSDAVEPVAPATYRKR